MARLWRVRDRASFAALRRDGIRRRAGALTVVRLPVEAGGSPVPAVAFAIGKPVGTAVARNRLRRRLRALLVEVAPPPGTYLVSAGPRAKTASDQDLRAALAEALA
jgi:ribonuclease P protein component